MVGVEQEPYSGCFHSARLVGELLEQLNSFGLYQHPEAM